MREFISVKQIFKYDIEYRMLVWVCLPLILSREAKPLANSGVAM
jgi:hypothetical protein